MGAVYRAIDRETGTDVAVKRLLDVRHAARFEIEARLLASLSHPRVVKVLDHSSDDQGLYIVMDLVHGVDLGATLKRSGDPGLTLGDSIESPSVSPGSPLRFSVAPRSTPWTRSMTM